VHKLNSARGILYERRRTNPEIDAVFQTGLDEPLFIKNLESVQGMSAT
jgi:hypothetical protein